jgi:YVTN family beta-propeller protein
MTPIAVAVDPLTNRIYVANSGGGTVTVIRGATNQTSTVTVGTNPVALAVNAATNHVYVANSGSNTVTVIDGIANEATTVAAGTNPAAISANPITGQVYVTNSGSDNATVIAEQRLEPLPLTTVISPISGNQTAGRTPSFVLSAASSYSPTNPPIQGIRYQIDAWEGLWQGAAASGSSFDAQTFPLALGQHVIYAFADDGQAGAASGLDHNVVGSLSGYFFTVVQGQSSTEASSSFNPSPDGESVTITASVQAVAPATGTPTGTVSFLDGSAILASGVAVNSSGQASFTSSSLAPGTHSITANYSGDVNFASSTSGVSQVVAKGQTAVVVVSNLNPSGSGQGVTLTATVSAVAPAGGIPTGTVSFLDGATILSTVVLNGSGHATFTTSSLAPGSHSITASYSGDANFAVGTSSGISQVVAKGQTSASVKSSANPSAFGQAVILTATVQGIAPATGTPTGTVSFLDGTVTLANVAVNGSGQASFTTLSLAQGTHSITASYSGDMNFTSSTSPPVSQAVIKGQSIATVISSLNPAASGQGVTLTATVQAAAPATGIPTGTVTFLDGSAILITVAVNASGQASFTTSSLAKGTHPISASYSGDVNFAGSISMAMSQVVVNGQTVATLASSLNPSGFGQGVTLTAIVQVVAPATGTPTGTVSFLDGTTILASGLALSGSGQATFASSALAPGTHSITASYGGDANFGSSTSSAVSQVVAKGQTAASLGSSLNPSASGQAVILSASLQAVAPATGTPTGTVSFLDGGTMLATVALNGGQASFTTSALATGSHSLTASYSGDANFGGNSSAGMSEVVDAVQVAIAPSVSSLTLTEGTAVSFSLTISSNSSLSAPVTFACAGLPTNTNCLFSPSSLSPSALPGKVNVTVGTNGLARGAVPAKGMFQLWYGLAILGLVFTGLEPNPEGRRIRSSRTRVSGIRSRAAAIFPLIIIVVMMTGLGCGSGRSVGNNNTVTPTGSFPITITATSGSLQATANITLTVTP